MSRINWIVVRQEVAAKGEEGLLLLGSYCHHEYDRAKRQVDAAIAAQRNLAGPDKAHFYIAPCLMY